MSHSTNGMTLFFHHHFRNGDYIIKMVMAALAKKGINDLMIAASALNPCHDFLIDHIKDGTVTAIETSGLRDDLGKYLTTHPGSLKRPVVVCPQGGRARAIEWGELYIDVAFMGVLTCDSVGNASGSQGKSACGSLGYALVDAHHADTTVLITDNLLKNECVHSVSIPTTDVDYIVAVDAIGDPADIASGASRITKKPVQLKLAELAADFVDESGQLKNGFSLQLGGGGASLAVAQFIRQKMVAKAMKGGFGIGGATGMLTDMLKDNLLELIYDTQTFDTTAVASLSEAPRHVCPLPCTPTPGPIALLISWTFVLVDLAFNVNGMTNFNGVLMGASGGHSDTAAGAKLVVSVCPLVRGRLPMIRDRVQTVGESIDAIVTERGIAINPKRQDLIEKFKDSWLPLYTIQELQQMADTFVASPRMFVSTMRIKISRVLGRFNY